MPFHTYITGALGKNASSVVPVNSGSVRFPVTPLYSPKLGLSEIAPEVVLKRPLNNGPV
jgi:hypothetical protein